MLNVQKHRGPDDSGIRFFSIAAGESGLWAEICQHNQEEISSALDEFIRELQNIKDAIGKEDLTGIVQFLEEARKYRTQLGSDADLEA